MNEVVRDAPAALPMQIRLSPIAQSSVDAEARTVNVVFTTGAAVRRRRWTGWDTSVPFDEILEVSREAVDLTRLNAGAPALDSHSTWSSHSQVGVVERAWIDGKEGRATIRFPSAGVDAAADRMFGLVSEGIVRNISVGYSVDRVRVVEAEKKGEIERRVVERWTPAEISFVTVPADPGAQVRSADTTAYPVEIFSTRSDQEDIMSESVVTAGEPAAIVTHSDQEARVADSVIANRAAEQVARGDDALSGEAATRAANEAAERAVRAERERVAEIGRLAGLANTRSLADDHVRAGTSVDAFRSALLDHLVAKENEAPTFSGTRARVGAESIEKRGRAIESALLHRVDSGRYQLVDGAEEFRGMTLLEIARRHLDDDGVATRGTSKNELASLALNHRSGALHSTGDFPVILGNVVNATLRAGYEAAPQTFRPLVREVTVSDFKAVKRVQLGEAPSLERVNEHGEYKRGSIGEAGESYAIATYGKIVAVTRQVLINDDLGAFTRIPQLFGVQAAQLESDLVWAQILGSGTLSDGKTLFHSDHKNLASTAAKLSAATAVGAISLARAAIAKQTGLDGKTVLNLQPSFIIVPVGVVADAEKIISGVIYAADKDKVVPASVRSLQIISEARLDNGIVRPDVGANIAGSADAWYLAASPSLIDTVELAYLEGNRGVYTEQRHGFDVDGVEIKVRLDVGAKALDFRGFYKNPGA